jgi:hypothetical protein
MSKHHKDPDPFHDIREWQDHRYDPGYFLGGRIHPILKGSRPNRYGYVLIVSGLISIFLLGAAVRAGQLWMILSTGVGGFVSIVAGLRLLRKGKKSAAKTQ